MFTNRHVLSLSLTIHCISVNAMEFKGLPKENPKDSDRSSSELSQVAPCSSASAKLKARVDKPELKNREEKETTSPHLAFESESRNRGQNQESSEDRVARSRRETRAAMRLQERPDRQDYTDNFIRALVGRDSLAGTLPDSLDTLIQELRNGRPTAGTGLILHGPPGSGKTTLAQVIAKETGCAYLPINSGSLITAWAGSGSEGIRAVFEAAQTKAQQNERVVIFFDEAEWLFAGEQGEAGRAVGAFNTSLHNLNPSIFVILATNYLNKIMESTRDRLRPIEIASPDQIKRKELTASSLRRLGGLRIDDLLLNEIARRTDGFTCRDIIELCEHMIVVKNSMQRGGPNLEHSDWIVGLHLKDPAVAVPQADLITVLQYFLRNKKPPVIGWSNNSTIRQIFEDQLSRNKIEQWVSLANGFANEIIQIEHFLKAYADIEPDKAHNEAVRRVVLNDELLPMIDTIEQTANRRLCEMTRQSIWSQLHLPSERRVALLRQLHLDQPIQLQLTLPREIEEELLQFLSNVTNRMSIRKIRQMMNRLGDIIIEPFIEVSFNSMIDLDPEGEGVISERLFRLIRSERGRLNYNACFMLMAHLKMGAEIAAAQEFSQRTLTLENALLCIRHEYRRWHKRRREQFVPDALFNKELDFLRSNSEFLENLNYEAIRSLIAKADEVSKIGLCFIYPLIIAAQLSHPETRAFDRAVRARFIRYCLCKHGGDWNMESDLAQLTRLSEHLTITEIIGWTDAANEWRHIRGRNIIEKSDCLAALYKFAKHDVTVCQETLKYFIQHHNAQLSTSLLSNMVHIMPRIFADAHEVNKVFQIARETSTQLRQITLDDQAILVALYKFLKNDENEDRRSALGDWEINCKKALTKAILKFLLTSENHTITEEQLEWLGSHPHLNVFSIQSKIEEARKKALSTNRGIISHELFQGLLPHVYDTKDEIIDVIGIVGVFYSEMEKARENNKRQSQMSQGCLIQ